MFDLDGTLVDSKPGIVDSLKYALSFYGIIENDEEKLNSFIGPPIHISMFNNYGFDEQKSMEVTMRYRQRYAEKGIFQCAVFPKAKDALKVLAERGASICLATSKPQIYAESILKRFGLKGYFNFIQGADMAGKFCEKFDIITACVSALSLDKNKTLMVGDRKYDVLGAKLAGIKCAGVLCGYGGRAELSAAGADYVIENIGELI